MSTNQKMCCWLAYGNKPSSHNPALERIAGYGVLCRALAIRKPVVTSYSVAQSPQPLSLVVGHVNHSESGEKNE